MPRTKVVCTIGPASRSTEVLARLVEAGMSVVRLNFSHGTHPQHREVIHNVRGIAHRLGRPIAVIQDLAGPKIRIGKLQSGSISLRAGQLYTLTTRRVLGDEHQVSVTYPALTKAVKPGDPLLLGDGALELEVTQSGDEDITCRVIVGGPLLSGKGIHLPTRTIEAPSLSEKDKNDLAFGMNEGVDFVALSFVRSQSDITEARHHMKKLGRSVPIIAKIEKHEALSNIDEIIQVVDGIMVARGDLGIETSLANVPLVQKMLIEKCNRVAKPVITATEMLRSMVENPRPTRAEVTDVANAILDGTDAVMLSEETAVGKFPVEAAAMMAQIAQRVEKGFPFHGWMRKSQGSQKRLPEAVAHAACQLAEQIGASSIITCTELGLTSRLVAKYRPSQPILAATPNETTFRRLALVWGVVPIQSERIRNTEEMLEKALAAVRKAGLARPGETVVLTAGPRGNVPGTANLIKAETVTGTDPRPPEDQRSFQ